MGSSDWGWRVNEDSAIVSLMQQHSIDRVFEPDEDRPGMLRYGRPFLEVTAALRQLTGTQKWELELDNVTLDGNSDQQRMKRDLFRRLTRDWAEWWAANWQQFVDSEDDAQIEQTLAATLSHNQPPAAAPRTELPVGEGVILSRRLHVAYLAPFNTSPVGSCLDLDTGHQPVPPLELIQDTDTMPSAALLAWAEREGVDLIGIEHTPPGGQAACRCAVPVDMRLRSVTPSHPIAVRRNEETVVQSLRRGTPLELPKLVPSVLFPDASAVTIYAFVTREGSCGFLKLNPAAEETIVSLKPKPLGNYGLSYQFILEIPPAGN